MIRDVGDGFPIEYQAADPDTRALTDATVALTVYAPDGTATTPTPAHAGTGTYRYTVVLTSAGPWRWKWDVTGAVTDVAYGSVTARDPAPDIYATLAEFKSRIDRTDTTRDEQLSAVLEAASRAVDDDTGRRFWLDTTVSARTYNPWRRALWTPEGEILLTDDIGSATGLVVEFGAAGLSTWTAVDSARWELLPENAAVEGWPTTGILLTAARWRNGPTTRVRITSRWGWPAVPAKIREATLLRAHRLYARRGSPEGVAGFSDMGVVRVARFDPDYQDCIARFVLSGVA